MCIVNSSWLVRNGKTAFATKRKGQIVSLVLNASFTHVAMEVRKMNRRLRLST